MATRNIAVTNPAATHYSVQTSFYRAAPDRPDAGSLHVLVAFPHALGGESIDITIADAGGTAVAPFTQTQANNITLLLTAVFNRALNVAGYV